MQHDARRDGRVDKYDYRMPFYLSGYFAHQDDAQPADPHDDSEGFEEEDRDIEGGHKLEEDEGREDDEVASGDMENNGMEYKVIETGIAGKVQYYKAPGPIRVEDL